jgi:hypothetical protein
MSIGVIARAWGMGHGIDGFITQISQQIFRISEFRKQQDCFA